MSVYHGGDFVTFTVEGDLAHAVPRRAMNYEETVEYFRLLGIARTEVLSKYKFFFLIINGGLNQSVPEQRVRALVAQWTANNPIDGMATYGMSPVLRIALALVMNAANLLRKGAVALAWPKDEASARQWIDARRAQLQAQVQKSKG